MEQRYIDPRELAARIGVKIPTVRAWVRLTDIPRLRVGRLVRFDFDEVVAWLRDGGGLAPGKRMRDAREQVGTRDVQGATRKKTAPCVGDLR